MSEIDVIKRLNVLAIITNYEKYQICTPLSLTQYYREKVKDKTLIIIDDVFHGKAVINTKDIISINKVDEINYGEDVEKI